MANRFWVGATNTWNATAGTKWALTSGGAGGQTVPTASDDVFFDGSSGAVTITLGAAGTCRSLTMTGFTGTFTGSSDLSIGTTSGGGLTISVGTTFSYTGNIFFVSTSSHTLTSNGKSISAIVLNGTGVTVTLGDSLNLGQAFIYSGTLNTNGKSVTVGVIQLVSIAANNRTLTLGSSLVNVGTFITDDTSGGTTTVNPGTSVITMNSDGGFLQCLASTETVLNRLILSATTNTSFGVIINGSAIKVNDYFQLTGYVTLAASTALQVDGAVHLGGSPTLNISTNDGSQVDVTINGTITPGTSILADINALGTGSWNFSSSGASVTDGGNNTGITFPTSTAIGTAVGTSVVSGVGKSTANSVGSATGTCVVSGITGSGKATTGTAIGTSSVSGVATATATSTGTSLGVVTVLGVGKVLVSATGTSIGVALVNGIGNIASPTSTSQPTEYSENILMPVETAESIAEPTEYGENIQNPTEYAA